MLFITEIIDDKGQKWAGDRIEAISWGHADFILESTGRGYMVVIGRLTKEIDEDTGEIINHELLMSN